jgi:hypothetical protein
MATRTVASGNRVCVTRAKYFVPRGSFSLCRAVNTNKSADVADVHILFGFLFSMD